MGRFQIAGLGLAVSVCICAGCSRDVSDPFALAPATPYSTWTPMKGGGLVSSRYCNTVLPPMFESSALSIAEIIDITLQNNPSTRQTWALARSAAAQYGQSLSPFYPNIGFDGSYLRSKGTFVDFTSPVAFYATQAGPDMTLSLTLFDFGQRTSNALAAREALYYADLNHNQEIQNVIQQTMDDAYQYLFTLAVLRANEANLENAQMSLDAANQRFSLGLAALGDVAQARTQFLQSKINLTTQKQNVEDAFARLATDMGLPASLKFKVQQLPEQVSADPLIASVDQLVSDAQAQRQDFLAALANMRSKEALLLKAKRATLPVLDSSFDVGHYWFQGGVQEPDIHWSMTFSLTFPIFNGFYYTNGVKAAQANLEASQAELLKTELSVVEQVTTAHMGVQTAAMNLGDSYEYLKAAELEFQIAMTSYKAGTATILDVMSAQSSLADARSKKAKAQKDWFASLAAIAHATGALCSTPDEGR